MRTAYFIAAAANLVIMAFLPAHYSPVNLAMVCGLTWLACTDSRPQRNRLYLYLSLAAATIIAAVGSVAAERSDGMLFTFLLLCLIFALIPSDPDESSPDRIQPAEHF